jgi:hypothetical protein
MLYVRYVSNKRPSIFITDRPILSTESMLHKIYDFKGSIKKSLVVGHKRLGVKMNLLAVSHQS